MNFDGGLSAKFRKRLAKMPERIQKAAFRAFLIWLEYNNYSSLHFKHIRGKKRDDVYSMCVNKDYRMLGEIEDDYISWYWIGPHHEYNRIVRNL